ncbi:hypothetical protein [Cryobacterium sp. Y11]|uniref:hypothetical protein n=1 Tax=Cryobacterium sp. Y11 TaxID=2045016 RepID=UPI000CE48736|nr:hypothetical protein [Cryobacterium sp. Y11]
MVGIVAVFVYILSEVPAGELFEPVPDADNSRVGAVGLLRAAAVFDARLHILQRVPPADDPSSAIVTELRSDAKELIHIIHDLLESAEIGGAAAKDTVITDVPAAVIPPCSRWCSSLSKNTSALNSLLWSQRSPACQRPA